MMETPIVIFDWEDVHYEIWNTKDVRRELERRDLSALGDFRTLVRRLQCHDWFNNIPTTHPFNLPVSPPTPRRENEE
jgi:hypothetical protein